MIYSKFSEIAPFAALEAANPGLDSLVYRYSDKESKNRIERYVHLMEKVLVENSLQEITALSTINKEELEKFMERTTKPLDQGIYSGVKFDYLIDPKYQVKHQESKSLVVVSRYAEIEDEIVFEVPLKNGDKLFIYSRADSLNYVRLYKKAKELQRKFYQRNKTKALLKIPLLSHKYIHTFQKYHKIAVSVEERTYKFSDVLMEFNLEFVRQPTKKFNKDLDFFEIEDSYFAWVRRSVFSDPLFVANLS